MLIRDPVHGDIALGALEAAVLDLPDVQRLRGIKQLGTASLVYPGALHTRFDHSLGASAVAHRIVAGLRREGLAVPAELDDLIAIATLLHDVTHVPFGHTLEDERRLFPRHDKGTRLARLLDGELGAGLARLGIRDEIAALLGAPSGASLPAWASEIVSSTVDADLLDYLRRDSYFTGLAHDYDDRVFHYFTVADDRLGLSMARHGMDRPDARSEVIQLLRMRYFLTERVYYHHTKVAAGAMISKAVELALAAGVLGEPDLLGLNDWTLLDRLARSGVAPIVMLVERLQRRALLKRGYVASARSVDGAGRAALVARYHEVPDARRAAEAALGSALGCAAGEVIVYCPALTVMKEAAARVVTSRGLGALNDPADPAGAEIRAIEERYAQLWRLYVFVPPAAVERAAAAAAELFGYPSEHR
ncbi:MAG: HD domain-containing protein [Deltaproteobacteria bacterium]|nr:HD domain-containing protein [Deltaproteobacteria bacterium]